MHPNFWLRIGVRLQVKLHTKIRRGILDNDKDFIMKQVKSFAEGLGYVLGKKRNGDIEVVFQQENQQKNKFLAEIEQYLEKKKYREAIQSFFKLKYELEPGEYLKIGNQLLDKLKARLADEDEQVLLLERSLKNFKERWLGK
ncbi:hypothetical protein ID874_05440 [Pediococcus acidilactici]|nr:hypothetical protein [Pediococcus acidilactici]QOP72778.1 hypothetical protein ID874_05440 [Pediococcus acidilactici]